MKIPISLSYKYFSETITVRKKVDSLHIGDTLDMYKSIIVPIYGQEAYERAIVSLAQSILEEWEKKRPIVFELTPPREEDIYIID
jgi:hypothetical protein